MRYDSNRQEMIDKIMCKPGYTWNETLQKCLGYGGVANPAVSKKPKAKKPNVDDISASNPTSEKPIAKSAPSTAADQAISKEVELRSSSVGL